MRKTLTAISGAVVLFAAASISASSDAARGGPPIYELEPTIAFTSTRDHANAVPLLGAEVYLATPEFTDPDSTKWSLMNLRRLTDNDSADGFASLSPDGKKIVFDSTRLTGCPACPYPGTLNRSDLFLMNTDGTEQVLLRRASSSATWSPNKEPWFGKYIAFHASASGEGTPLRTDPGSASSDSDIFVANVDDLLAGGASATNITRAWTVSDDGTRLKIADDPDWSPDGERILFTAHDVGDEGPNWPNPPFRSNTAEIYVIDARGTGPPTRLTANHEEERGPSWSPDGSRIAFACRAGTGNAEICVMKADGKDVMQLTHNSVPDLTPTWSLDGRLILFHRRFGDARPFTQQLHVLEVPPADQDVCPYDDPCNLPAARLTSPPGFNNLANWGELRVKPND